MKRASCHSCGFQGPGILAHKCSGGRVGADAQAAIVGGRSQRAVAAVEPPARPSRFRATPTTVDGWRFRSKTEAALYAKACRECAMVLPPPRFPLACLAGPGEVAPVYTPDLLVVADSALGGWIEAWEAKGPKSCESRDYTLRARAFRQSWQAIPLRVFRMVKGRLVEDAPARAAVEG